jgi:hypothetical protein
VHRLAVIGVAVALVEVADDDDAKVLERLGRVVERLGQHGAGPSGEEGGEEETAEEREQGAVRPGRREAELWSREHGGGVW